jgi:hypothetical protein
LSSADTIWRTIAALVLCLSGCGLLEVGPANRITTIEPVSFRVRVLELGPLDPERVSFPSDAPISEFLPGDRVRFEIEVVDTDGLALADEQLDSVWLLFNSNAVRLDDPALELRCDELEAWTLDTSCRLGEGRGSIEFEAPGLGEEVGFNQRLWVYAVIAWNGQSADECWTARRDRKGMPSDCDFMVFPAAVGPSWFLLGYAASLGVYSKIPVELFHPAVYLQQANRAPKLDHVLVELEGAESVLTPSDGIIGPIAVEPGQIVNLTIAVDENSQFGQAYFFPLNFAGDLFTLWLESVQTRVATAGPIRAADQRSIPAESPIVIEIDDDAEPGLARVVLAIHDSRGAEDVVRVELEIQ